MRRILIAATAALVLFALSAPPAMAADYSFTGGFNQDDNVQLFNFAVGAQSDVTLRTWSYAGGTNAAGQVIPRGGFDPILAVFDNVGLLIGQNDDGGFGVVPADAVTGMCYDTFLQVSLGAGNYVVSVMQYNNFALGPTLANGFQRVGQPNFTQEWATGPGFFYDVTGDHRDGHWAFDILNVSEASTVVPLPSAVLVAPLGAVLIGLFSRRFRR